MVMMLLFVDCPHEVGWHYSILSESCVKIFLTEMDFVQALNQCNMFQSRLVEVNDKYEEMALKKLFE